MFNNLKGKSVGNSKKFYSNEGNVITETNFNKSASTLSIQKKEEINKILIKLKE